MARAGRALAASNGLEVTVGVRGLEEADGPRPPAAVEAAAYFVVAEALTNAGVRGPTDGSGRCYGGSPGPYRGMSIRTRPRPPESTRSWALAMSASG